MKERRVRLVESGNGPYGQFITAGRHVISADEPIESGGQDTGLDPYELILSGLGACTAMTVRLYANRQNWPLEAVGVEVVQTRRASYATGVKDRFERFITLTGTLTAEQRTRLISAADRCPVSEALKTGAEVTAVEAAQPEPAVV